MSARLNWAQEWNTFLLAAVAMTGGLGAGRYWAAHKNRGTVRPRWLVKKGETRADRKALQRQRVKDNWIGEAKLHRHHTSHFRRTLDHAAGA